MKGKPEKTGNESRRIDYTARSGEGTIEQRKSFLIQFQEPMKKHGEFQQDEQHIVLSERDNLQLLKELEERSRSTDSKFSRLGRRIIFL